MLFLPMILILVAIMSPDMMIRLIFLCAALLATAQGVSYLINAVFIISKFNLLIYVDQILTNDAISKIFQIYLSVSHYSMLIGRRDSL